MQHLMHIYNYQFLNKFLIFVFVFCKYRSIKSDKSGNGPEKSDKSRNGPKKSANGPIYFLTHCKPLKKWNFEWVFDDKMVRLEIRGNTRNRRFRPLISFSFKEGVTA